MKEISGDILNIDKGIIVHQVNCQRVMGAGLALQIRNKWPIHYKDYLQQRPQLGNVFGTWVNEQLVICGVYGQEKCGNTGVYTNYEALEHGLKKVARAAKAHNLPVYIPYKIGCGLAGGNWETVCQIIQKTVPDAIIVKYDSTDDANSCLEVKAVATQNDVHIKNRAEIIQSMTLDEMAYDLMDVFEELFEDGIPTKEYFREWLSNAPENPDEVLYSYRNS